MAKSLTFLVTTLQPPTFHSSRRRWRFSSLSSNHESHIAARSPARTACACFRSSLRRPHRAAPKSRGAYHHRARPGMRNLHLVPGFFRVSAFRPDVKNINGPARLAASMTGPGSRCRGAAGPSMVKAVSKPSSRRRTITASPRRPPGLAALRRSESKVFDPRLVRWPSKLVVFITTMPGCARTRWRK